MEKLLRSFAPKKTENVKIIEEICKKQSSNMYPIELWGLSEHVARYSHERWSYNSLKWRR